MRDMIFEAANEGSSFPVVVTFADQAGAPAIPDSATWTLQALLPAPDTIAEGSMGAALADAGEALDDAGAALGVGHVALDEAAAACLAAQAALETAAGKLTGADATAAQAAADAAETAAGVATAAGDVAETAAGVAEAAGADAIEAAESPTIINSREDVAIPVGEIDEDTGKYTIMLTGDDLQFLPGEGGMDSVQRMLLVKSVSGTTETQSACEFTLNRLVPEV